MCSAALRSTALDVLERSPGVTVDRQNNALSLSGKGGVLVMINGKLNRLPMDALVQVLAGMLPLKLTPGWQVQTNLMGVWQQTATHYEGRDLRLTQAYANLQVTQTLKLGHDFTGELTTFYRSPFLFGLSRVAAFGSVDAGLQKKLARNGGNLRLAVQDLLWTYKFRSFINQPQINLVQQQGFIFEPRVRLTYTRPFGNQNVKAGGRRATGSEDDRKRVSADG